MGDDAARWAFAQWELRARAQTKFQRADEMLFVREALEQATHEAVASFHASHFPVGEMVADLTTGIGADLIALAKRGPVIGFEMDAMRADYALHNLKENGHIGNVVVGDSLTHLPVVNYAFADPARRIEGRRTLNLEDFSPSVQQLATWMRTLKLGGIKLSPMLSDEVLASLSASIEFVSFGRECREAILWFGTEARAGKQAVHVESGAVLEPVREPLPVEAPGAFLHEADPAAIRAHCLGALCNQFEAVPLGDSNGYLSGQYEAVSPWLRSYPVLYSGPGDLKKTRAALRDLKARPVLKQRGTSFDLNALAKTIGRFGDSPVFLAIYTVEKSVRHVILKAP